MGFLGLRRLGQKDTVNDYQGVLVPLSQAKRHSTIEAEYARRKSAEKLPTADSANPTDPNDPPPDYEKKDDGGEEGVIRTNGAGYDPYTLEGLRAEVNEDVAASGHDSAYDRKFSCEWLGWSG
jgi:hypothetical protein